MRDTKRFTVVATDLRGYGDSSKPRGLPDHSNYSFRRMAEDQLEVMAHLGFEKFAVRVTTAARAPRIAWRWIIPAGCSNLPASTSFRLTMR